MSLRTPSDLMLDQLRDLYSVECQVILTLPALASAATDPHLRQTPEEGKTHAARLSEAAGVIFSAVSSEKHAA